VKLVDILDSCTLSALKKDGYKHAERHKNIYQLDMILHVQMAGIFPPEMDDPVGWLFYFSLMDLYANKVKEVSIEFRPPSPERVELKFRGISRKVLVRQDLNRVLRAKKEYLGKTR
jgi:hypothetical protein